MRISVDFPAPFGPSRPKISPSFTLNETSLTAVKSPYFFTMWSTSIADGAAGSYTGFSSPAFTCGEAEAFELEFASDIIAAPPRRFAYYSLSVAPVQPAPQPSFQAQTRPLDSPSALSARWF